ELQGLLSESCSPMVAHARHLKAAAKAGTGVVFAGPCIAKKRETDEILVAAGGEGARGGADVAITFRGLRTWLQEAGIDPAAVEPGAEDRFTPERASKGVLYPVDGGMIASVKRHLRDHEAHFVSYSGLVEIEKALDGLDRYDGGEPIFLELLACEGGCVNGPRCERRSGTVAKRLRVLDYARDAREEAAETSVDLSDRRTGRGSVLVAEFPEEKLREALRQVGKHRPEDELNCSGCGYDTCRAFAAALLSGRAERTMCVSYMRDLAQKKADALVRAMPSGVVVADAELRVVECNEKFAKLLGGEAEVAFEAKPGLSGADLARLIPFSELFARVMAEDGPEYVERDLKLGKRVLHGTVFVIERGAFAGGVFQDVTLPSVQRDRVVTQAKAVIDKNLRTVQRIAYLLGENAADTESILDSIIESFAAGGEGEEGSRR
ncbi:MAG: PAS domain-containing protein, partial [Spirochaetaceae bacterium]|nr:PAS domain-containing protein [Spirochaetaceae bacterium]